MTLARATRTIGAATLDRAMPSINYLMAEHKLTAESALNIAMDPKRLARFLPVRLSDHHRAVRKMSDNARALPGSDSSISTIRLVRGLPIDFKVPDRQRDEIFEDYKRRLLNRSIATPSSALAIPQGSSPSPGNDSFAERSEAGNAARKQRALNDPVERKAKMAEYSVRVHQPWGGLSPDPATTGDLARFANEYAEQNRVDYPTALREVGKRPSSKWRPR
jgi:hypothetical protein